MFLVVLKKELLENLLSFKFLLITTVTALLVSTSTFVMYRAYQLQLENYDALKPSKDQPVAIIPPSPTQAAEPSSPPTRPISVQGMT